jgi:hypothetical protein
MVVVRENLLSRVTVAGEQATVVNTRVEAA